MKTQAHSETELVQRAETDLEAFGELVERYRGSIYRQCFSRVGDRDYAEDLAQETFVRAYMKLDQLQDESLFPNWLRKIASNTCSEFLRSSSRREHPWEELIEQPVETAASDGELNDHLLGLPDETRVCVELYYGEQLSYSEIAEVLGVTEGTVRNRLHRARAFLREEMADLVDKETSAFTRRVIQKLEELQSKNPQERTRAADALRRSLQKDRYQTLLSHLHGHIVTPTIFSIEEEKNYLIEKAIQTSKRYRTPEIRDALIDLMLTHDFEEIRLKAAGALVAQKDPASIPYLKQAMEDPKNPQEVAAAAKSAIKQLEKLPPAPQGNFESLRLRKDVEFAATDKTARLTLVKRIQQALGDPVAKVRMDAAKALGELGDKRAVPSLIKALDDTDKNVRIVVTQALGKLKSKRAVPALLDAARRDGPILPAAAITQIGATDALPALLEVVRDCGDVKALSIMALAPYGIIDKLTTPENLPQMKQIINSMRGKDADFAVEWALIAALAKSENPDDVPEIITLIDQPKSHAEGPRGQLIPKLFAALGRMDTDQAFGTLKNHVMQGSTPAAYAITNYGARGLSVLIEAMQNENIYIQEAALRSLIWAGGHKLAAKDVQAVSQLQHLAENGKIPSVRMHAKMVMRKMRR